MIEPGPHVVHLADELVFGNGHFDDAAHALSLCIPRIESDGNAAQRGLSAT
jgi:hypothetical protein